MTPAAHFFFFSITAPTKYDKKALIPFCCLKYVYLRWRGNKNFLLPTDYLLIEYFQSTFGHFLTTIFTIIFTSNSSKTQGFNYYNTVFTLLCNFPLPESRYQELERLVGNIFSTTPSKHRHNSDFIAL